MKFKKYVKLLMVVVALTSQSILGMEKEKTFTFERGIRGAIKVPYSTYVLSRENTWDTISSKRHSVGPGDLRESARAVIIATAAHYNIKCQTCDYSSLIQWNYYQTAANALEKLFESDISLKMDISSIKNTAQNLNF